jgi:hypothetical protein
MRPKKARFAGPKGDSSAFITKDLRGVYRDLRGVYSRAPQDVVSLGQASLSELDEPHSNPLECGSHFSGRQDHRSGQQALAGSLADFVEAGQR